MSFKAALVGDSDYMRTRLADLLRGSGFDVDLRVPADLPSILECTRTAYDIIILGTDRTAATAEQKMFEFMSVCGFLFLDETSRTRTGEQTFLLHPEMSPEEIIAAVNGVVHLNAKVRRSPRIKVSLPVEYEYRDRIVRSTILELGERGLFIRTLAPLQNSAVVSVRFALPGTSGELVAAGHVAFSIGCDFGRGIILHPASPDKKIVALPGMGVIIDEMKEQDREAIRKYIQQHS